MNDVSRPSAAPIQHPPGFRARRGRNWFFLGLTYASYYLCRYNLSPIAPELKADLHLDNTRYGAVSSGRDALYAVGQMVNGLLTDRLGGKSAMTIGAVGTILLNLAFGLTTWSGLGPATMLYTLVFIRSADGYMQAFGAPGFIKINTAWFRRKERGTFAGVFGAMINLGAVGAGQLASLLATGFVIPLYFAAITVPSLNWRYMFIIPPVIVAVVVVFMNLMVKNTPEEAGFRIVHDDEPAGEERFTLWSVLTKIASNPTVWLVAGAYFCTGFVRRGVENWWAIYLKDVWSFTRGSWPYTAFVWGLPVTATLGSLCSGIISDRWFAGRRAPVAALLYLSQTAFCIAALLIPHGAHGSVGLAVTVIIAISMMCNSTHSLLGTAAAMDLGGPKMAGCSSGIIDSFQYYGSILSGIGLGVFFDLIAGQHVGSSLTDGGAKLNPAVWVGSMIPFGLIGTSLMTYVWLKNRGTDARGT